MEMISSSSCYFVWLVLLLCFPFVYSSFNTSLSESLDALLHDHAFNTLFHGRPHTGALYTANLPANLAGMKVSALRMRSRTLWRIGLNLTNVCIPPRTLPVPYVRRLLIVYHDLGNWSSIYNNISGYTLLTSVIGITLYDASNLSSMSLTKLNLKPAEKPVLIQFNSSTSPSGSNLGAKCATFDAYGNVRMSETSYPNVCQTRSLGYFSLVTPSLQQKVWIFWVIGFVLVFFCLFFLLLTGTALLRAFTMKRTRAMEREADEGEVLHTFWVNSSKMPRATITRTPPVLENSGASINPVSCMLQQ